MRHGAGAIEVGKPGAADGTLPQNASPGCRLNDRCRQPALSFEIAPGRRVRPNRLSLGPAGGDASVRLVSAPCPTGRRKTWRQSGERSQALADISEAKPWLEPLHEGKTSPVASLVGSHQPRPAWLTMRISPLPRRYFRLSFVLSFRSSFQHGGVRSSTTAQCTLSRNSSISGSCRVISTPRV